VADTRREPGAGREHGVCREQPGQQPDRHRQDEIQIHLQVRVQNGQHAHNRQRCTARAERRRGVAQRESDRHLSQSREDAATDKQRGEVARADVLLDQAAEEVDHDAVHRDVAEAAVGENRRDPRPDVQRIRRVEREQRPVEAGFPDEHSELSGRRRDQSHHHLDGERQPHQREKHERHVPAEVAQRPAGPGVDAESVGDTPRASALVLDAVVEPTVEHAVGVVPLLEPRTVVILRQAMVRAERPTALTAVVRQVLLFPTQVARRHLLEVRAAVQRGLWSCAVFSGDRQPARIPSRRALSDAANGPDSSPQRVDFCPSVPEVRP